MVLDIADSPATVAMPRSTLTKLAFKAHQTKRPIFLTGHAGAGKSTLARTLAGLGRKVVSTGDELRKRQAWRHGPAIPLAHDAWGDDDEVEEIVAAALWRWPHVVIDGWPRREEQALKLVRWCQIRDFKPVVLFLQIDPDEALQRYELNGYRRSDASGKYGPEGELCPLGGVYAEPIEEHYRAKRRAQDHEIEAAREVISLADKEGYLKTGVGLL